MMNAGGNHNQAGGGPKPLTARQKRALAAILAARNYEEAIPDSGVCRQTFYSYLRDPSFKAELDRQLNQLMDSALGRIKGAAGEAVETLRALIGSDNESIRLRAAQGIIDYTLKARELEIGARLDEIEKHLEGLK